MVMTCVVSLRKAKAFGREEEVIELEASCMRVLGLPPRLAGTSAVLRMLVAILQRPII